MNRRPIRGEGAQQLGSLAAGAALVVLAGYLTLESSDPRPVRPSATDGGADAAALAPSSPPPTAAIGDAGALDNVTDGGLFLPSLSLGDASVLPTTGGPRSVKIGVVLVTFSGADGAPASARSKPDARALAERLAVDAKADFHHAVTSGDTGSADDIGRITRNILDPHTEAAVFALESGQVSEILETSRGYWIVKRID